jgi:uncharacterized membrane protein YgcG
VTNQKLPKPNPAGRNGKIIRVGVFTSVLLLTNILRLPSLFSSRADISPVITAHKADAPSATPASPIVRLDFRNQESLSEKMLASAAACLPQKATTSDIGLFSTAIPADALLDLLLEGVLSPKKEEEPKTSNRLPAEFAAREVSEFDGDGGEICGNESGFSDIDVLLGISIRTDSSYDSFRSVGSGGRTSIAFSDDHSIGSSNAGSGNGNRSNGIFFGNGSGGGGGGGFSFRFRNTLLGWLINVIKHNREHLRFDPVVWPVNHHSKKPHPPLHRPPVVSA